MPFEVVIDTKKKDGVFADNSKTLYKIHKLQKKLSKYDEFSKPLSIVEAVKFSYQAYKNGRSKFYILPGATELKKLQGYVKNDSVKSDFTHFLDSNKQITRVSFQMADIGTEEMDVLLNEIRPKINSIFSPEEYNVTLTGTSVVYLKGTEYLVKGLVISLLLAVFLISLFMAGMFYSFRMVLVSLIPNLIPLLFTAAIMGYFNISIKPSTILVFSIALGISVDNTIHFLAKYRQELRSLGFDIKKAVNAALRETGVSMIYSSNVLLAGFGIFIFSNFGGTQALGMLVSITLLLAVLSNLLFLPSLLLSLEKSIITKAFKEPMIEIYDEEEDIDLHQLQVRSNGNNSAKDSETIHN